MEFNCIILAGGKSSRLNTDKALIHFHGKSLLKKIVDSISPLAKEIIVISNDCQHKIKGATTFSEDHEKIGPLGGIKTGLQHSDTDWNLILSIDMPLLDLPSLIKQLQLLICGETNVTLPISKEQCQYLAGFYHRDTLSVINNQIARGEFALKQLLPQLTDIKTIESNLDFSNINTIQDIEKIGCGLVKIVSFGQVSEKIGSSSFTMMTSSQTVGELETELKTYYPTLSNITFRIAVNQTFEPVNYQLRPNDEIALLPPFAGG